MQPRTQPTSLAGPLALDGPRAFVLFAALLIIALWLIVRPYLGLRHDGLLYLGQIMLQWHPDVMSRDLFFQYGSQDQYSIVAPMLAWLYRHVGMGEAQMALTMLNHLAVCLLVLAWLRRAGLDTLECILGLAALCVMSHNYGGWNIFSFSERFVTGRTFAEPAALLALFLIERRRLFGGFAALTVATVMHPLVALSVLAIAWALLMTQDRRWAWAGLAIPFGVVLAVAGVAPFSSLLQTIDAEWLDIIRKFSGHLFVAGWPAPDMVAVLFDCATLLVAARVFPAQAMLLRVVVAVTAVLCLASLVGTDLLHNHLMTQLQLWRVHWVTHLLALALLPALVWRTWRDGDAQAQTLVFAVGASVVALNVRYPSAVMLTAWAGMALWLHLKRPPLSPGIVKAARIASAFGLLGMTVLVAAETWRQLAQYRGVQFGPSVAALVLLSVPSVSLPLTAAIVHWYQRGGRHALAALALAVAGAAFGGANWDQRPAWTRYLESNIDREHPFERYIPRDQQVLWWDNPHGVWGLLHRANFWSIQQGAGMVFHRATAMEHHYRAKVVGPIQLQKDVCDIMGSIGADGVDENCWPTFEAVEESCRNDERLAFIILNRRMQRGVIAQWTFEPTQETFYLHDCKQIR